MKNSNNIRKDTVDLRRLRDEADDLRSRLIHIYRFAEGLEYTKRMELMGLSHGLRPDGTRMETVSKDGWCYDLDLCPEADDTLVTLIQPRFNGTRYVMPGWKSFEEDEVTFYWTDPESDPQERIDTKGDRVIAWMFKPLPAMGGEQPAVVRMKKFTCLGYWRKQPDSPLIHVVEAPDGGEAIHAAEKAAKDEFSGAAENDVYINTFVFHGEPKLHSSWAG
jgi:hypothetical protein